MKAGIEPKTPHRELFEALAAGQDRLAQELLWLVGRSIACLVARLDEPSSTLGDVADTSPMHETLLARARGEGESAAETDQTGERCAVDVLGEELFCLIRTLRLRADMCARDAARFDKLAREVRPGRPKRPQMNLLMRPLKKKGRPGRKPKEDISNASLVSMRKRAELHGISTHREAASSFAEWFYEEKEPLEESISERRRAQTLKAARSRLEKRLSALLPVRKSSQK